MALLSVQDLTVTIATPRGPARILERVSFGLEAGESLGLVGESGCGKSMTALAVMGLLPEAATASGRILLDGQDLLTANEKRLCALRGRTLAMVFQEPMSALNPVRTIGRQVTEGLRLHLGLSRTAARDRAAALLDRVGLPLARFPLDLYPHQLSGGQRQRVVLAIALACRPRLLIADEPTTALDVIVQARILDLIAELAAEEGTALLMITHDLGVVAQTSDQALVMHAGRITERAATGELFHRMAPLYTRGLFAALPRTAPRLLDKRPRRSHAPGNGNRTGARHRPPAPPRCPASEAPLLEIENVVRDYRLPKAGLLGAAPSRRALDGVSLTLRAGESLGILGESGSGKSTLARLVMALERPDAGQIRFRGQDLLALRPDALRRLRRNFQMVFQDPYGSLDPRHRVGRIVAEPLHGLGLDLSSGERRDRVAEALQAVGLEVADLDKYPHEFSGGQRQRIAIARALITAPALIVADEPVSALDASVQAQVLNLMADLQAARGLTYLFISHDLSVVRHITDRVAVMRHGRIVEQGRTAEVFARPGHPYTQALLAAVPTPDRGLERPELRQ